MCGEEILAEASEKMPALMRTATPEDRAKIGRLRENAHSCMDVLASKEPAEVAALASLEAIRTEICACVDKACAAAIMGAKQDELDKTERLKMSHLGAMQFASETLRLHTCLGKFGLGREDGVDIAIRAATLANSACMCTSVECMTLPTKQIARLLLLATAPSDLAAVRAATERVSGCAAALRR